MVYTILISIVFVAEVIIAISALLVLWNLDKKLLSLDNTINDEKATIKEICSIGKGISIQLTELAEDFKEGVEKKEEDFALKILSKMLTGIVLWKINSKIFKKLKCTKAIKIIGKGFKLLEYIV